LGISLSLITKVSATEPEKIDESINQYQEIMDKLTDEFGVEFYINPEKQEQFYSSVKDMTPNELEQMLRNQYQEFVNNYYNNTQESLITPFYMREDITQKTSLSYNSSMYLKSTVFSTSGTQGTFIYENIKSYGTTWPSGFTGYHWEVDSKSHKLSSNSKSCKVTLRGHPENANGVALALSLTASHTFYAN